MKENEINFSAQVADLMARIKNSANTDLNEAVEAKKEIAQNYRDFVAVSASGEFMCLQSHGSLAIYKTPDYLGAMVYALARVCEGGVIAGISGNSGDKFDKLSDIEKMDCQTIIGQLQNQNIID